MCVEPSQTETVFWVDISRLDYGSYEGGRKHSEGDICKSYSADVITYGRPIRPPFQFQGSLWTCVGMMGKGLIVSESVAYRLGVMDLFQGETESCEQRTVNEERCAKARESAEGFYHGIEVRHRGKKFVLCGPPAIFKPARTSAERCSAVQLRLF
jgi:hypothetical protein